MSVSFFKAFVFYGLLSYVFCQEYLGCYRDSDPSPVLSTFRPGTNYGMSVDMCFDNCRAVNKTYAGVKSWYECWCGDNSNHTINGPQAHESQCNTPCATDSSQMCGGRSHISVYSVCSAGRYLKASGTGNNCDNNCHCENGAICNYGTGQCPGACQVGYTEESCNEPEVNPCSEKNGGCSDECVGSVGSYHCLCFSGYHLAEGEQHKCTDIDECADGRCNQGCTNTDGSYLCTCHIGYQLQEGELHTCTDIDECSMGEHGCSEKCSNTPGSYRCDCYQGYHRVEGQCQDIDECAEGRCNQDCINTYGSYQCTCHTGFHLAYGDLHTCTDIDECEEGNGDCRTQCSNTPGSYQCICEAGEQQDSKCAIGRKEEEQGLSGATVGLIVGGLAVVVLLAILAVVVWRKWTVVKKAQRQSNTANDAIDYDVLLTTQTAKQPSSIAGLL